MNCKMCTDVLHDYLERNLSRELTEEITRHLEVCESCRIFVKTYIQTINLSRQAAPPCCVTPEMMERLKAMLRQRVIDGK